jgi:succinate dehydrogenase/fumarate reductase flavoprotein subunit
MNKKTLQEERIDTDVLVVGAGTGGMMAAIGAADCGASVILCEKGNAKRSGGIRGGNDHFMCYIPEIHGPAGRENILNTLDPGQPTDQDVFMKLWDLSYGVVQKWESWGVNMKFDGHYEFTGHGWPGSSGKTGEPGKTDRIWLHFSDFRLSTKLEKQVRERNVRIINRVMISDLLKDARGRVVGAIGISTRVPKLLIIRAKSVVYNTGGVGATRLYPSPRVIEYSMAEPETGDGDIMAYRAGADIEGAEFSRRHVSLVFGPFWGQGSWIGVVRDSEGKPIAPPYLTRPDAEIGDPSCADTAAHDHVWATGKGPVWMDTRELTEADEQYMRCSFDSEAMQPFVRWLEEEKIDIRKSRFEFAPTQPLTHMRARVDTNFMTTVEGLYSTLRPGLSRSAISGISAGEAAAKYAHEVGLSDLGKQRDKILKVKQEYEEILNREGPQFAGWREAQWAIWQIMDWYAMPNRRSASTLMAGYNQLLRVREKAKHLLKADNQHDLYHCLEVLNLLDIVELVLLAVNERKESRGEARRLDYPFTNPMLNKILIVAQKRGKPTFKWEEPRKISK